MSITTAHLEAFQFAIIAVPRLLALLHACTCFTQSHQALLTLLGVENVQKLGMPLGCSSGAAAGMWLECLLRQEAIQAGFEGVGKTTWPTVHSDWLTS